VTFAHTIRQHRLRLRLTQAEFALWLDRDKQTVSNWECGRSTPWPKEQQRVLAALGAPPQNRERIVDRILRGMDE
jgi:DNA-binding transcriptional regulator YiaG